MVRIGGVESEVTRRLEAAGIRGPKKFLEIGATRQGRTQIAAVTGLPPGVILERLNHTDLMRISGVGEDYSKLLEAAGVQTVRELARRNPERLLVALTAANAEAMLVRKLPTRERLVKWIDEAKRLPQVLKY